MKKLEFDYYDWDEFLRFLNGLSDKDAAKLLALIQKIEEMGLMVAQRQKWVKKLENNLYEIRSKQSTNIQRAFYFQVFGNKYMITNAFTKKTQKAPESEKIKAIKRRDSILFGEKKDE